MQSYDLTVPLTRLNAASKGPGVVNTSGYMKASMPYSSTMLFCKGVPACHNVNNDKRPKSECGRKSERATGPTQRCFLVAKNASDRTCQQQDVAALHAAQRLGGQGVHVAHAMALIQHQVAPCLW